MSIGQDVFLGKARVKSRCFHTVGFSPPLFLSVNSGSRVAAGGVPVMWCDVRYGVTAEGPMVKFTVGVRYGGLPRLREGKERVDVKTPCLARAFVAGCDGRGMVM